MRLIRLLKQAHAIEIGAYHAYEGHWRSLAETKPDEAKQIVWIQSEEQDHKLAVERLLRSLNAKPSKILDGILWIIGKTISGACHVMGYRAAMFGAKIMEKLGSNTYWVLAREAYNSGHPEMHSELCSMARNEEEHEKFFEKRA